MNIGRNVSMDNLKQSIPFERRKEIEGMALEWYYKLMELRENPKEMLYFSTYVVELLESEPEEGMPC